MSKKSIWYGFLEAGEKSSPVATDDRLNTGDPKTLYLFNLKRGEILEYKREIVEPKLRELRGEEAALADEMKSAFEEARRGFKPRAARVLNVPEQAPARAKPRDQEETFEAVEETELETGDEEEEEWAEEEED